MAEEATGWPGIPRVVQARWFERRWPYLAMAGGVAVELALGLAVLSTLPLERPTGWLPTPGRALYVVHGLVGLAMLGGALWGLRHGTGAGRLLRVAWWGGMIGMGIGALGGLAAVAHPLRLLGMALMLVGSVVALLGYLIPLLEPRIRAGGRPPDATTSGAPLDALAASTGGWTGSTEMPDRPIVPRLGRADYRSGDSAGGQLRRRSSIGLMRPTSLPSGSATMA